MGGKFFYLIIKFDQLETTIKPNVQFVIGIDQSLITHGKIISKGKMLLMSK